jgi:sec-independent protein translocase protein TatB
MFEIGFWEMVLVAVVTLVVVGPERLPSLARDVGLWLNRARRVVTDIKAEVDLELQIADIKKSLIQTDASLDYLKDLSKSMVHSDIDAQDRTELNSLHQPANWSKCLSVDQELHDSNSNSFKKILPAHSTTTSTSSSQQSPNYSTPAD